MSSDTEYQPPAVQTITQARLKLVGPRRNRAWDLYAGEVLIGWTPEDPGRPQVGDAGFTPSCWGYGSGQHVTVRYSPTLTIS